MVRAAIFRSSCTNCNATGLLGIRGPNEVLVGLPECLRKSLESIFQYIIYTNVMVLVGILLVMLNHVSPVWVEVYTKGKVETKALPK